MGWKTDGLFFDYWKGKVALCPKWPDRLWGTRDLRYKRKRALFQGVKLSEREACM